MGKIDNFHARKFWPAHRTALRTRNESVDEMRPVKPSIWFHRADLITFHALHLAAGAAYVLVNSLTWPNEWPQFSRDLDGAAEVFHPNFAGKVRRKMAIVVLRIIQKS